MPIQVVKCPLCQAEMEYRPKKYDEMITHIWSCPACPFVGFEFYNENNSEAVHYHLNQPSEIK